MDDNRQQEALWGLEASNSGVHMSDLGVECEISVLCWRWAVTALHWHLSARIWWGDSVLMVFSQYTNYILRPRIIFVRIQS